MANNKSRKKNIKDSKKTPSFIPTQEEKEAARRRAEENMKRLGIETVEEYIAYIDKNRGY